MLIYFLFSFFITYVFFFIFKKFDLTQDNDFNKPQAIHSNKTIRFLGLPIIPIFFFIYFTNIFGEDFIYHYFFLFAFLCSFVGLLDDFGFKINPYIRFLYQVFIICLIFSFSEEVSSLSIFNFLPSFLANKYFMIFFTIFAILTIANSINFIDGCNGLVILLMILIISYLLLINNVAELSNLYLIIIIYLFIILTLNFPKSWAFLGDFGSYFLGYFISFLLIHLSNSNISMKIDINEWFFANLLVYPAFEIFSSVFRRLKNKKSPFYPDNSHLHSLIYRLLKFKYNSLNSNYLTTLIILIINFLIYSIVYFISPNLYYLYFFIFFISLYLLRFCIYFILEKFLLEK